MSADLAVNQARAIEHVQLYIPGEYSYQLVFRSVQDEPVGVPEVEGVDFHYCSNLGEYTSQSNALRQSLGLAAYVKGALKMLRGKRAFYFVRDAQGILHHAWITHSLCRHYYVETDASVIGPIWTSPKCRSRGIGTFATSRALNELRKRGHKAVYIDTSNANHSALRVIEKCGFGPPLAAYIRGRERISGEG